MAVAGGAERDGAGASRAELLAAPDAPALGQLPAQPYSFATWLRRRPGPDYHVEVDGHWHSVPFRLIGQVLDVRSAAATVEVFRRLAGHQQVAESRREHEQRRPEQPRLARLETGKHPAPLSAGKLGAGCRA